MMSLSSAFRIRAASSQCLARGCKAPSLLRNPGQFYFSTRRSDHYANSHDEKNRSSRYSRAAPLLLGTSIASGIFGYYLAGGQSSLTKLSADSEPFPALRPTFGSADNFKNGIAELRQALSRPGAVSTNSDDLLAHGFLNSKQDNYSALIPHPSVVVYPESTDDVVKIVKIANKYRMPVVPFSGATSLEGHLSGPSSGGICVDLNCMDKILAIHEEDSDLVCQPAAQWMKINETLRAKGIPLFFPIDPGPGATVGGMLSTGCSGTNAVRYGTAKGEWFLNATVVLPSGEVIKTRRRSRKSAAGFDMTKLFIGAEGTLGIVTEVTIRLAPVLPTTVAVVHFPDVKSATAASIEVINRGVGIQCVELLDPFAMKATNNYGMSFRKWPEKDSLYFKFQGPTQASLKETAEVVKQIVKKHGGTGFSLARNEKEAEAIWTDRKNLYHSGMSMLENARSILTDVCVPISKLPQLITETKKDLASIGILSSIVGHVGDGNFHALLLFQTEAEYEVAMEASKRLVHRAIALDGTCTGEHGVGTGKKQYLEEELGEGTVKLMKTIKQAIDPLGLFNPGKLYPDSPPPNSRRNSS